METIVQSVRATVKAQRMFSDKVERQIHGRLKDSHNRSKQPKDAQDRHKLLNDAQDQPLPEPDDEPWLSRTERVRWQILRPSSDIVDWSCIEHYLMLVTQRTGQHFDKERLRLL